VDNPEKNCHKGPKTQKTPWLLFILVPWCMVAKMFCYKVHNIRNMADRRWWVKAGMGFIRASPFKRLIDWNKYRISLLT
jgi:hypothetical protein